MQVRGQWTLGCFHTPGRSRVGSSDAPWFDMDDTIIHILPPATPYWIEEHRRTALHRRSWILFSAGENSGLPPMVQNPQGFARFVDPERTVSRYILEMTEIAHEQEYNCFWLMQDMFAQLCRTLSRAERQGPGLYRIAPTTLADVRDPLVSKVLRFIAQHVKDRFAMPELARATKASVTTLTEHFRAATGETPLQALRRMRLGKARALIALGMPLDVIAEETGFSDAFHLSREFKRHHGMSPSAYRAKTQAAVRYHGGR